MYEKETGSPLLHSKETTIQSSFIIQHQPEDPIQQYNYVIQNYNLDENLVDHLKLEIMPESNIHHHFWRVYSNPCAFVIFLASIAVPGLGCLVYLWFFIGIIIYFMGLSVFNRNRKKVADPFQNMIFSPELCRLTNSLNKSFDIKLRELEGFSFNPEVISILRGKNEGENVRFMVYGGKFWDYYNNYPKYRGKYGLTLVTATVFLLIQGVLIDFILTIV